MVRRRMELVQTRQFGPLEIEEAAVLHFPLGLPGFEYARRFVLMEQAELAPIVCLQSLDMPGLCLWTAPAGAIDPGYSLEVNPDDLTVLDLGETSPLAQNQDVLCLAVLCASENGLLTANLL